MTVPSTIDTIGTDNARLTLGKRENAVFEQQDGQAAQASSMLLIQGKRQQRQEPGNG